MNIGEGPVLLFDGVCNLCSSAVQFILDHERPGTPLIRFAPIQSEVARGLMTDAFGAARAAELREGASGSGDPDTMILIEGGRGFTHSGGALRVTRHLRAPWRWAFVLLVVPRPLRDLAYRFVARNRYRWFGKSDACRVPTPDLRARFLA